MASELERSAYILFPDFIYIKLKSLFEFAEKDIFKEIWIWHEHTCARLQLTVL